METNRLIHLLAKKMGKEASEAEEEELKQLLNQKPEFTFFKKLLDAVKSEKQTYHTVKEDDLVGDNWNLIRSRLDKEETESPKTLVYPWHCPARQRKWRKVWKWAAIWISILLLSGSGLWLIIRDNPGRMNVISDAKPTIRTTQGTPERFVLPDKTVVWLNSKSSIKYAGNFTKGKREIYLEGEAYFDVEHDAGHPFIVHAGNVDIKVLGTSFNVQAYKNEDQVETTLINGKIKVQVAGSPYKSFVLKPDEKLTIHMDMDKTVNKIKRLKPRSIKTVRFKVEELEPAVTKKLPEVAWMKDRLVFQNESFEELAKSLERRYNVTIIFKDISLKEEKLNGIFKNENIQKALKILQMTTLFNYKMKGDTVYLRR